VRTRNFNTELLELRKIATKYQKRAIEKLKMRGVRLNSTKITHIAKVITGYHLTKKNSLEVIKKYCDGKNIDLEMIKKMALKENLSRETKPSKKIKKQHSLKTTESKSDVIFKPIYDPVYTREKAKEFYTSPEWRTLRVLIIEEQKGECQMCGRSHKRHGVTIHVDHIVPISIDWSRRLDKANLQLLCEDCNLGKSNRFTTDWRQS
jgi:hypothetical protein